MAKGQANDVALASTALIDAVTGKNMATRFIFMALTARERPDVIHMEMPINGKELIEYMHFLGKGQYFKSFGAAFDPQTQVMELWISTKQVLSSLEKRYEAEHDSNPFQDLQQNSRTEVIGDGECIIWSKGNRFLFLFHSFTGIGINVMPRNEDNIAKARKCRVYLRRHFAFDPRKGLNNRERINPQGALGLGVNTPLERRAVLRVRRRCRFPALASAR